MGIFDVVKDVAKVGTEILPIVLDNMATGTQSQQNVPLGPIKVSVDDDQIYVTNLGNQPKDVIFNVTNSTGGAKSNITLSSDKSKVTYSAETSLYEASVNLPNGFDPEPLISSIDLQVQINARC
jgi:hypothetical protein